MAEGGEVVGPGPFQQVEEARRAVQCGAERQGVDEEPDTVAERLVVAPGDGCADDQVVAAAELGEGGGERGVQHHERRRTGAPRQRTHPLVEFGVEDEVVGAESPPVRSGRGRDQGRVSCSGAPLSRVRQ